MTRNPDTVLTLALLGAVVACLALAWYGGRQEPNPSGLSPAGAKIVDALTEFRDDLSGRRGLTDAEVRRLFPCVAERMRSRYFH